MSTLSLQLDGLAHPAQLVPAIVVAVVLLAAVAALVIAASSARRDDRPVPDPARHGRASAADGYSRRP